MRMMNLARALGFALVFSGLSTAAWAVPHVPEMDPGMATSAMALLGSGMLLITGRRRSR
jgi:hypothetical protein